MRCWLVVALVAGCSPARSDSLADEVAVTARPQPVARRGAAVDLPGEGTGAYWDAASSALFVADATHGALLRWTSERGFAAAGSFPSREIGSLVRLADGRFMTPSFGFGSDGG